MIIHVRLKLKGLNFFEKNVVIPMCSLCLKIKLVIILTNKLKIKVFYHAKHLINMLKKNNCCM